VKLEIQLTVLVDGLPAKYNLHLSGCDGINHGTFYCILALILAPHLKKKKKKEEVSFHPVNESLE
jgi:hypothetical protein